MSQLARFRAVVAESVTAVGKRLKLRSGSGRRRLEAATRALAGGASSRGEWEPIKYDDAVFDARSAACEIGSCLVQRVTQLN